MENYHSWLMQKKFKKSIFFLQFSPFTQVGHGPDSVLNSMWTWQISKLPIIRAVTTDQVTLTDRRAGIKRAPMDARRRKTAKWHWLGQSAINRIVIKTSQSATTAGKWQFKPTIGKNRSLIWTSLSFYRRRNWREFEEDVMARWDGEGSDFYGIKVVSSF